MKFENLAFVGRVGYAYYSGAKAIIGGFCQKENADEVSNTLEPYTFSDLDGKHGHVEGDLLVIKNTDELAKLLTEDFDVETFLFDCESTYRKEVEDCSDYVKSLKVRTVVYVIDRQETVYKTK